MVVAIANSIDSFLKENNIRPNEWRRRVFIAPWFIHSKNSATPKSGNPRNNRATPTSDDEVCTDVSKLGSEDVFVSWGGMSFLLTDLDEFCSLFRLLSVIMCPSLRYHMDQKNHFVRFLKII